MIQEKQAHGISTLNIDGKPLGARSDQTILDVARENGIRIPTLCNYEGISTLGACRLCIVEVEGMNRPVAACVTRVREGMVIRTDSEQLRTHRRMVIELLFSERNHTCSVCIQNGHCELQSLADEMGMEHVRFPYLFPSLTVDASHSRFVVDHNRCVLCSRCVRVCDEVEGAHTWDLMGRGVDSRVITDRMSTWGESESCTSCGKCVNLCPTAALTEKGRRPSDYSRKRDFLPYLNTMRRVQK